MQHAITTPRGAIWAAEIFSTLTARIQGGINFIVDQCKEYRPLDNVKSPEDLIEYANTIRSTDPSFADDLIAAATRAMDER